jgi:hypothetical protein
LKPLTPPSPPPPRRAPCSYQGARSADKFMEFIDEQLSKDKGFARVEALDELAKEFVKVGGPGAGGGGGVCARGRGRVLSEGEGRAPSEGQGRGGRGQDVLLQRRVARGSCRWAGRG